MGSEMKFIGFFILFVIGYFTFMSLFGAAASDPALTHWTNDTHYTNDSSFYDYGNMNAPECEVGGGWSSFVDVPVCIWNYVSFGFSAATTSSDVMLINLFIFIPLGIVFMFMLVKAYVRG